MHASSEPIVERSPSVSIILPTYNRARFLPEAIASIRAQQFTDWELIIVDDGSTDETPELLPKLTADIQQPVQLIHQENQGAYGARNTGLDHASGRYIAFFDSDDIWLPHHLKDCVSALDANPEVDWVYDACRLVEYATGAEIAANSFYVDGRPRPFQALAGKVVDGLHIVQDYGAVRCQLLHGLYCGLQNSVIRRSVFDDYRFEATARNEAEDQLVVIDRLLKGYCFAFLDSVGVVYQVHAENSSAAATVTSCGQERRERVLTAAAQGFELLLKRTDLPHDVRFALLRRLGQEYFWHLGYATYWSQGDRSRALECYWKAIRYWPWDWRYWKTSLAAIVKLFGRTSVRAIRLCL
jgi:glycosyltransferase involved in cell wall biosynthesis